LPYLTFIGSLPVNLTTRCTVVTRRWHGEVAVFDERTGDTHLVGGLAGRILEICLTPSEKNLETTIAELPSVSEVGSSLEDINRAVAELRMLGLVM
jgi:PqqD family protein of HPr-rel-A system